MDYEIRIWKDPKKMPNIEPQKAAGRLEAMANKVKSTANMLGGVSSGANPDILIDKTGGGDNVIQSIDISYLTVEVDSGIPMPPPINQVPHAVQGIAIERNKPGKKKVRVIKIHIKGNLYLPLKENGIVGDAKSMVGLAKEENKIRDTLLLSKWAKVIPEDDASLHFYRGIIISVLTKAGDFRVITAKKVYLDSYTENYTEGEFGTFELSLIEKVDSNVDFEVEALGYEEIPLLKSVGNKLEKAAKVVATTGAVIAGVGAVGKAVTETVEKFTGETPATRWIKYGFDTASSAGNVAKSTSNVLKNPKDPKTWTDEITNVNKNVNERIQKGVDAREDIPLATMEALYLGKIKSDPDRYKKYIKMSEADKREELKKAAEEMKAGAKSTKDMEKAVTNEKEIANLEKEYLDLIKKDPEQAEKYNKATAEEKLKMLQDAKKNFDDIENKYAALIKLDPKKYDEYNKASTDKQLEMLQEAKKSADLVNKDPAQAEKYNDATDAEKLKMLQDAKKNFDDMESKYLDEIKKDPKKFDEYQKAPIEKQLDMLNDAKKAAESSNSGTSSPSSVGGSGTSSPSSGSGSGTSTPQSSTGSGTSTPPSDTGSGTSTPPSDTGSGTSTPPSSTPPSTNNSAPAAKPNSNGTANLNDKINAAAQKKNGGSNGK